MTLSDLMDCVIKVNLKGFEILEREHQLIPDVAKNTDAARVYPVPTSGSLMCPGQANGCFHGVATGGHGSPTALEGTITLVTPPGIPPFHRVAVGAVIDVDKSRTGAGGATAGHANLDAADPDEGDVDLPVVLAVGINYGQGGYYVNNPLGLRDHTAMRPRVAAVVQLLSNQGVQPLREPYHLVAANFFPWITTDPWNVCTRSVLTEELLLRYFGWPNPLDFVVALIQALQRGTANLLPENGLTHVIFHGAQNATMRGGLALTGQLTRDYSPSLARLPLYRCYRENPPVPPLSDYSHSMRHSLPGPDVIFCDNLAPSQAGTHIHNAVRLWQKDLRASPSSVMDTDE